MDFSLFKKVDIANKRKEGGLPPKVQEYDNLKFRKALSKKAGDGTTISKFTVSKKKFAELDLDNNALYHFAHPDKNIVLIGVVADEDGKLLRKRKDKGKGDSFKSDALEAALVGAGIIDGTALGKNQFIDANVVGTDVEIEGMKVFKALQLSKGASKPKAAKTVVAEPTISSAPETKEATVKAEAPAATTTDWD